MAGGADDNITVMLIRNGGKLVKSNKTVAGFAKLVVLVIILAVLTAFIASMLRGCSEKPVIEMETPSADIIVDEPKNGDFATSESSKGNVPSDDDFVLRSTSPNE